MPGIKYKHDPPHKSYKKGQKVAQIFESIFYSIGESIAHRPLTYIFCTFLLSCFCALGFFRFHFETRPEKLWVPAKSDYVNTWEWQKENYRDMIRIQSTLFETKNGENILQPKYFKEIYRLHKELNKLSVNNSRGESVSTPDLCFQIPDLGNIKNHFLVKAYKEAKELFSWSSDDSSGDEGGGGGGGFEDFSLSLDTDSYCQIFDALYRRCLEINILQMWKYNENQFMEKLTQEDILNAINTATKLAYSELDFGFQGLLGGIERNETGHIVGARTIVQVYVMVGNTTSALMQKSFGLAMASLVDPDLYKWEKNFMEYLENENTKNPLLNLWSQAKRSFDDASGEAIKSDSTLLLIGNVALQIYVIMMLGKLNRVEMRPVLGIFGFFTITLSVISSFGACAALGLMYGPLHSFLPLILIGLGVDDMFVLMQSWENLKNSGEFKISSQSERFAKVLQKAGVAICVTSVTGCVAFAIGSISSIPALSSFCLYSATGVAFLFLTQITMFFPFFTIDQTRLEENKNGLFWCIKHKNWKPGACSQASVFKVMFSSLGSFLMKKWVKVAVIVVTISVTAVCAYEVFFIAHGFDLVWFISTKSYLYKSMKKLFHYYSHVGGIGNVFLDKTAITEEFHKVGLISKQLHDNPYVKDVISFYEPFVNYTRNYLDLDISQTASLNSTFFLSMMGKFLMSTSGARYTEYFSFDGDLVCGEDSPSFTAARILFAHPKSSSTTEKIAMMESVKDIIRNANFTSGHAAATAPVYFEWEAEKLLTKELTWNLSSALVSVFAMTTVLIANIRTAFLVFLCVLFTLVDVVALMSWWGLTINSVTCINLILCVGLSVDYSAHLGLHFMKVKGSKEERVKASLIEMGPPILNGAFSTYLAFVLLSNSGSYFFTSFFKIFTGVFVFGVFQGLMFLPVMLSLLGSPPYSNKNDLTGDELSILEKEKLNNETVS